MVHEQSHVCTMLQPPPQPSIRTKGYPAMPLCALTQNILIPAAAPDAAQEPG